ncbi:major facilitator superfamily MFS_1 [Staphylothermus hellenicus DSM 12710]|uniref:Major facilitator superfamily MFS_1 n=1 Tax=Staphylothermus hellenicus (strain DSM 12710 / JCM 10830 / BK20S6-10-b1 / P8) TaxID=591019 RepID=D7D8T3_STAHD|nr:major facilitator superfamily MFS_1 [Staphylothermus hellenicus DSM 12710]
MGNEKKITLISLYIYTFIRGAGRASYMFLYPLFLISIGYSTKDLGLIATIASALIIVILPIIGHLVDLGWAIEVLFLSGLSLSLALIIPVIYPSFYSLIISYALNMLSLYLWSPSRNKIIGAIIPQILLGRVYSLFVILFNSSRTITPFILGRLTETFGYEYLMIWMGIFSFAGTFIVYLILVLRQNMFSRAPIGKADVINSYKAMLAFDKSVIAIIIFALIDSFAWRLWFPLLNAYLKEYRRFTDPIIGDYNTVIGLSMLVTSYFAGVITDRIKPIKSLIVYELIGAVGILLINLPHPYIHLSALLIGFSIAFWVSAYNTLITVMYGVEKIGRLRVLTDSVRNISSIPAPQIGGYLMSINPLITFTISALLMSIAIIPLRKIRVKTS